MGVGSEFIIIRTVSYVAAGDDLALIGFALTFGLLMRLRKNLYPLILFHILANIVWGAIIGTVLARWH